MIMQKIKENGMKIADSERQTVNSRIQGSAGDMTKKASIILFFVLLTKLYLLFYIIISGYFLAIKKKLR